MVSKVSNGSMRLSHFCNSIERVKTLERWVGDPFWTLGTSSGTPLSFSSDVDILHSSTAKRGGGDCALTVGVDGRRLGEAGGHTCAVAWCAYLRRWGFGPNNEIICC